MSSHRPTYASATCETHRNVGPRGIHGCVTLEFERAPEFQFNSKATWPDGDDYAAAIESVVRETLVEIQSKHTFKCSLVSIKWHSVDSCQAGFECAARHATHLALDTIK